VWPRHIIFEMLGQTSGTEALRRAAIFGAACVVALALTGCGRSETPPPARAATPSASTPPSAAAHEVSRAERSSSDRDLSSDEAMGGHTLARHVGKTDDELRDRLRREPGISSASTYTDRATAEAVVGAALSSPQRSFETWRSRTGRRPNLVLHFAAHRVIGRSVGRHRSDAAPCEDALVVLRWDDRRDQFYVMTSYPEERRRDR
jgi:hypothetical protein